MTGDVDYGSSITIGDIEVGEADLSSDDLESDDDDDYDDFEYGEGGPGRDARRARRQDRRAASGKGAGIGSKVRQLKKNLGAMTKVNISAPVDTPPARLVQAKEVAQAATVAGLNMPGVAMHAARIPAVIVNGGTLTQPPTEGKIPGSVLQANLLEWSRVCATPGRSYTASPSSGTATLTIGDTTAANAPGGAYAEVLAPLFFISVTASDYTKQKGAEMQITITGKDENGNSLTSDSFTIKRSGSDETEIVYIPYIRIREKNRPRLAQIEWHASTPVTFVVVATSLTTGELLQVTVPGVNSEDMLKWAKAWGLTL